MGLHSRGPFKRGDFRCRSHGAAAALLRRQANLPRLFRRHQPRRASYCHQRTGGTCDGRATGFVVPVAVGRAGNSEILSNRACSDVCRLAMSRLICPNPSASSPMLCRTAARPDDIASNCSSRVEEGATGAGRVCGMGATCLEDCQPKAAATPMQNANRSAIASNIRLSSNTSLIENQTPFWLAETRLASSDGLVTPAEIRDRVELNVELIGAFRLLAGWQKHGHHRVGRESRESCGQSLA
jgi:hypothetical protein